MRFPNWMQMVIWAGTGFNCCQLIYQESKKSIQQKFLLYNKEYMMTLQLHLTV